MTTLGYPCDYVAGKARDKLYDQVLGGILSVEERIIRQRNPENPQVVIGLKLPLTQGDVAFLLEDINRGKSAVTGIPTRPMLIRWRRPTDDTILRITGGGNEQKSARLKLSDLVCMTKEEALRHQNEILLGNKTLEELYTKEVIDRIESRLAETARWEAYR